MLKLEKISKTRDLNVLLRAKPTLLTARFLIALAYALFIHLTAFVLFKVAPLKIDFQFSLFPPVSVAVELPVHSGVYVALQDEEPIPEYLIAPLSTLPKLPMALESPLVRNSEYIKLQSPLDNAFLALEDNVELEAGIERYPLLSIYLSGAIADLSLEPVRLNENAFADASAAALNQPERYIFRVLADQNRGEIFWWELIESDSSRARHAEALSILKSLQFVPEKEIGIVSGEIEIVI